MNQSNDSGFCLMRMPLFCYERECPMRTTAPKGFESWLARIQGPRP
jgi:hypothetical protein